MSVIERFRYKVNLERYMADCDANYARLLRLAPKLKSALCRKFSLADTTSRGVEIAVVEQTPYTTLLQLSQNESKLTLTQQWLGQPTLKIRLYHDAKTAEVVNCDQQKVPWSRYDYPNERMHQQDEKAQWNRFLAELLGHYLHCGCDDNEVFDPI